MGGAAAHRADDTNARWAAMLSRWSIPDRLISAAPESPYFFDPEVFIDIADDSLARQHDTASDAVAREALPNAGIVLDVGVGAGAASLRLRPGNIIGVDPISELLATFTHRARQLGIPTTTIQGRWPDVAPQTEIADVVVCHHLVYNVSDLAGFAAELTSHAHDRVVIEMTTVHPMAWMTPYWEALHGLTQPDRPTVEDAIEVLTALGIRVNQQRWGRQYQMIGETGPDQLARVARRLCLDPARHDELRRLLVAIPPPRERQVATLWWDSTC